MICLEWQWTDYKSVGENLLSRQCTTGPGKNEAKNNTKNYNELTF